MVHTKIFKDGGQFPTKKEDIPAYVLTLIRADWLVVLTWWHFLKHKLWLPNYGALSLHYKIAFYIILTALMLLHFLLFWAQELLWLLFINFCVVLRVWPDGSLWLVFKLASLFVLCLPLRPQYIYLSLSKFQCSYLSKWDSILQWSCLSQFCFWNFVTPQIISAGQRKQLVYKPCK